VTIECTSYGYQWTLCSLPVPVRELPKIVAGASCIQCGGTEIRVLV
jgi:hypothetical protein